jgi:hypothetical protein
MPTRRVGPTAWGALLGFLAVRQEVAGIIGIEVSGKAQLTEVVHTIDSLRLGLALGSAGNSVAAGIATMAITTSSSISVKAFRRPSLCFINFIAAFRFTGFSGAGARGFAQGPAG